MLKDDTFKGDWRQTRLPSLLILHNGPNVQAIGAVYTENPYVEPLSSSIPLDFNKFNTTSMETLPSKHAVDVDQVTFPYVRTYESSSGTTVPFNYIERISQIRLIIVKFGYGRYGVDAHRAAAQSNLAPALLNHTNLDGGWWMVVMETLEDSWKPCNDFVNIEQPCKEAIEQSVRRFHELGFIHGDLRDANLFVSFDGGQWDCQIIDYDWAGREGEVRYPIGVYRNSSVWRPEQYMGGDLITLDHDRLTVEEFLK
ncbi:hypothetical protein BDP27DRAFT_1336043 [Rhodocollybia butyracea]|uniref:Protein kinase domain-containing protein n=1 Tax=Rhodocollybia butyracea TaxID=206335 RepID=A0A9P5PIV3_9AGAR|nr:hypothetical protein BDP27DRAFT_1336043 [Rhodocollybia butyracea]